MDSGTKFSQLGQDELEELLSFRNTPLYGIVFKITQGYLQEDALGNSKPSDLSITELGKKTVALMGTRIGFNYILELPDKASKELEKRKKLKEKKEPKIKPSFYPDEI